MPVARGVVVSTELDRLRPYTFHGIHLAPAGTQAIGDCPFCGRDGKFTVETSTGLWRCFVCNAGTASGGGNSLTFIRLLYQTSTCTQGFLESVAADRKLLYPDTVAAWGIVPGHDGAWLVPGYGTDGKLDQLYRRTRIQDGGEWVWQLLPTPGLWPEGKVHALHLPIGDFDPSRSMVVVCEGPWDGMALWEVWPRDGTTNIIAVPGCNVWQEKWTYMCQGKFVTLMYDSDHPRKNLSKSYSGVNRIANIMSRAGYDGMKRVAGRLSGAAASVRIIRWGPDGFDPNRPSGWDVRDHLCQ
jgi:hypothetical protein